MSSGTPPDRDLAVAKRYAAWFVLLVVAGGVLFATSGTQSSAVGAIGGVVAGPIGALVERSQSGVDRGRLAALLMVGLAAVTGLAVGWVIDSYGLTVPIGVVATGLVAAAVSHAVTWAALRRRGWPDGDRRG